jgi:alpha-L-arabinofuranosidase
VNGAIDSFKGGINVAGEGEAIVLTSDSPQDTNTLDDPHEVVPTTRKVRRLGENFSYEFKPNSVTMLKIGT